MSTMMLRWELSIRNSIAVKENDDERLEVKDDGDIQCSMDPVATASTLIHFRSCFPWDI